MVTSSVRGGGSFEEFWIIPLFCTATKAGGWIEGFSSIYAYFLLLTPLIFGIVFFEKLRFVSLTLSLVLLAGIGTQYVLLEKDLMHCDSP